MRQIRSMALLYYAARAVLKKVDLPTSLHPLKANSIYLSALLHKESVLVFIVRKGRLWLLLRMPIVKLSRHLGRK